MKVDEAPDSWSNVDQHFGRDQWGDKVCLPAALLAKRFTEHFKLLELGGLLHSAGILAENIKQIFKRKKLIYLVHIKQYN